ncbi:MAG: hypothetical protein IT267_02035 [Saprospiraceae bacterium]|nr:hypothetical protein [Saprospiraceae bacterium]
MKKLLFVFVNLSLLILLASNKLGRASYQGEGSTGAPGEPQYCKNCHNGNIGVSLKIYLLDGTDTVKVYEPNKKYTIEVAINHVSGPDPKGYGFQLTGLKAELNKSGETITDISPLGGNVKMAYAKNKRYYAEHNGVSSTNLFRVEWIAPTKGTGSVSFYAAGNGVNANNNESGDGASKNSIQIPENIISSIDETKTQHSIIRYNIINDNIYLEETALNKFTDYQILDFSGKILLNGVMNNTVNVNLLPQGVYLFRAINTNLSDYAITKFIKK